MKKLDGRVAIVTGGGQGIGRACAKRFADEGARVVVADQNGDTAGAVAGEIRSAGGEAEPCKVDVRETNQVDAMVQTAVDRFGGVDILMNSAGVIRITPLFEIDEAEWDFLFDVNCKGTLFSVQAAARRMIDQGRGGKIINVASVGSFLPLPHHWPRQPRRPWCWLKFCVPAIRPA